MRTVLRTPDFRRLWLAGLTSDLGNWLMVVAIPYLVYDLTGSPVATAVAVLAETVPTLALGPLAGVLADRWDRRRTMVVVDIVRAATVLAILFVREPGQVWIVYVAVTVETTAGQLFAPSQQALVPALVGRGQQLVAANSLSSFTGGAIRLVGGPIGGAVYGLWGVQAVVLLDSFSYLVSAFLLARIRGGGRTGTSTARRIIPELVEGLRALWSNHTLRGLAYVSVVFFAANGMATALLAPIVATRLHGDPATLGVLMSALGAGYLLGAVACPGLLPFAPLRALIAGSLTVCTAGFALLAWPNAIVASAGCVVLGVGGAVLLVTLATTVQRLTADDTLGRVSASMTTAQTAATVVGASCAAALGGVLGTSTLLAVVVAGAFASVIVAVAVIPSA